MTDLPPKDGSKNDDDLVASGFVAQASRASTLRVVFAGSPSRLASLGAVLAEGSLQALPTSFQHESGVQVVLCPLVPAYAPLWPVTLYGAAVVVRLDEAAPGLLEAAADAVDLTVVHDTASGDLDELVARAASLSASQRRDAAG